MLHGPFNGPWAAVATLPLSFRHDFYQTAPLIYEATLVFLLITQLYVSVQLLFLDENGTTALKNPITFS